jgi:GNAT superfamily N-acetyltransferase
VSAPVAFELRATALDHPDCARLNDAVQAYYTEVFGGPDTTPTDPRDFAPPHGAFFVGYADTEPVTMGGWRFVSDDVAPIGARPVEIKRMYVAAEWRGRGLARQLLAHLEQTARAAGADAVILETGSFLVDAISLYRSSGYTDIGPFGHYADSPLSLHLGKRLDSAA